MRCVWVFVLVVLLIGLVDAKDLYVSPSGDDSVSYTGNDIGSPWRTPAEAWGEALAGDDVYFRAGTYVISSNINTRLSGNDGTSASPITFQNYNGESVTFSSDVNTVFSLQQDYNYISGINFAGRAATWFDLGEDSPASHFKIENCYADMSEGTGGDNDGFVRVRPAANDATIQNCRVVGPGLSVHANTNCLYVARAVGVKILNNELSNAPIGIYFKHANGVSTDGGEIAYNYITDTNRFSIFTNSNNANFHDNIIGVDNARIRFNEANGVAGGDDNVWSHNTILSSELNLNNDDGGADSNMFINNIIYSYTIESQSDGNVWDYNLQVTDSMIGGNDVSGSPTYVGGSTPSSINGFLLSSDSVGKGMASDGGDMGADVSLVGTGSVAPPVEECEVDGDGDGYGVGESCSGSDCDEGDASVHSTISCSYDGATCGNYDLCILSCPSVSSEICGDGIDNDCVGGDEECVGDECLSGECVIVEDTYLNLNNVSYSSEEFLNTYTWPEDVAANSILMRFDLDEIENVSDVDEVLLGLYLTEAGGDASYDLGVHRVVGVDPDLALATGETYDGVNVWDSLGMGNVGGVVDVVSVDEDLGYVYFDVTSLVEFWRDNPSENFGLLITSDDVASADSYRYFGSLENGDEGVRPVLEVSYLEGECDVADLDVPCDGVQVDEVVAVLEEWLVGGVEMGEVLRVVNLWRD